MKIVFNLVYLWPKIHGKKKFFVYKALSIGAL